jgi:RecJ-like exonuclease
VYTLAVVGSRNVRNRVLVFEHLDVYRSEHPDLAIVSGGAAGADTYAAEFAATYNIPLMVIKPDWDRYGRSAGFKRNHEIWDQADAGIAFWDGQSRGTAHSFDIAAKQGKPIEVVRTDQCNNCNVCGARIDHRSVNICPDCDPRNDLEYYSGPTA